LDVWLQTVITTRIVHNTDATGLHRDADTEDAASAYVKNIAKQRQAAVLLPLVKTANQWHLLFIRRATNKHDRHSGQVAFPGGATEKSDPSATATALRETTEEIGVTPDRIKIIAELGPNLNLETSEVARAFLIPLPWLRNADNYTLRARSDMDKKSAARHPIIVYNDFDGETLWGATARMTMNFFKALDDEELLLPA